jgi:hypothetical protein
MKDFDDPLDLLDHDGDGGVEMSLLCRAWRTFTSICRFPAMLKKQCSQNIATSL